MTSALRLVAAAIAVLAVVGGGAIWYVAQTNPPPASTHSPIPSFDASPTFPASTAASPTAAAELVRGWPGNGSVSAPGLYSWGDAKCESTNCVMGVLHRHDDVPNNDVRLVIDRIPEWSLDTDAGATPVTIAGHQGLYQRTNEELEVWNVAFGGTLVSISLSVERGTSEEVVDEAHAIVDSLVYEPRDTTLGFRLVFRLPTWLWDSPF